MSNSFINCFVRVALNEITFEQFVELIGLMKQYQIPYNNQLVESDHWDIWLMEKGSDAPLKNAIAYKKMSINVEPTIDFIFLLCIVLTDEHAAQLYEDFDYEMIKTARIGISQRKSE